MEPTDRVPGIAGVGAGGDGCNEHRAVSEDKLLALEDEGDGGLQAVRGHGVALEANRRDETLLEILLHHRHRDSTEIKFE